MDFASYASRARGFDLRPFTQDQLRKLARLFDRGAELADIVARYAAELGGHDEPQFRHAREVWHEYQSWQRAVREVSARRVDAQAMLLPEAAIRTSWTVVGLRVLEATDEAFGTDAFEAHSAWHDNLDEVAAMWQERLAHGLDHGEVRFGDEAMGIADLKPISWLDLMDKERKGTLTLELSVPTPEDLGTLGKHLARLVEGDATESAALLDTILASRLEDGIREVLHRRAVVQAVSEAANRYRQRLEAKALGGQRARSVFVGELGAAIGLAVVQRDGKVLGATAVDADEDPGAIHAWMATYAADDDPVVLPDHAASTEILAALHAEFEGDMVCEVPPDRLPDGDGTSTSDPDDAPAARAAAELARRAFKPRRFWTSLALEDLELLGKGIALRDDDQERLLRSLREVRLEFDDGDSAPGDSGKTGQDRGSRSARGGGGRSGTGGLNPRVRSIADLEPGLQLKGRVTNLNRYGAFVDVGIAKEGLIPIHVLTSGFTATPADVARVGQEVVVRVMSVSVSRRRFDLSLEKVFPFQKGADGGKPGQKGRGGRRSGSRRGPRKR